MRYAHPFFTSEPPGHRTIHPRYPGQRMSDWTNNAAKLGPIPKPITKMDEKRWIVPAAIRMKVLGHFQGHFFLLRTRKEIEALGSVRFHVLGWLWLRPR